MERGIKGVRWFFFFLLCVFISPSFAQGIPVNIKAEKLKFIEGTSLIEASGSVEVKLEKVIIHADRLIMDSETNLATAEGNVKLFSADYQASADRLLYSADDERSKFINFKSRITAKKVEGPLYLSAGELDDAGKRMEGKKGLVTSCEYKTPHYYVRADKLTYYPTDKIEGFNVTLYVGELPILWLPYLYYDFDNDWRRNWLFGHNEVEGSYIKSSWGLAGGLLYLDLMEKKGLGYGIDHKYDLLGLGAGMFYLYHLDEKDTGKGDWITKIRHEKQITPQTSLQLTQDYTSTYLIPSGRREQNALSLNLAYQDQSKWNLALSAYEDRNSSYQKYAAALNQNFKTVSTSYNINYELYQNTPGRYIEVAQSFNHQRPLWSDKVMLTLRANYYDSKKSAGEAGDEKIEPSIDITGRESNFSWRFHGNWYMDVDKDAYTKDNTYQYLESKPEIEISPDPLDLKVANLSSKLAYGNYHEVRYVSELGRNRDFTAGRGQVSLNLNKSWQVPLGTTLAVGLGGDQFFYSPGDQLYAYRENASLSTGLGGFFTNNLNYRKGVTDGNTPFLFDQIGVHYHDVTDQMTFYYLDKFSWSLSGGHNWQAHRWMDVDTNLLVKPSSRLTWQSRTGWDIENKSYKDWNNNLTLVPVDFFTLTFSNTANLNNGELRSASIVYDLFSLKGEVNQWEFRVSQVYEAATRDFRVRDIMIKKELHCWALQYGYNDYRKEFSIMFSLKALPDEPLGLSPGRGFYVEGVERELQGMLNEIVPEGAVTRY